MGGLLDRWSSTSAALLRLGLIEAAAHREVRWLEAFGTFIANTDMHPANLSFRPDGLTLGGLAPSYDLLPMGYAPRSGEIVPFAFSPRAPAATDADVARSAWGAAIVFWTTLASREDVSEDFRRIARANAAALEALDRALDLLPDYTAR